MQETPGLIEDQVDGGLEALALELDSLNPRPVDYFTPDNLEEIKQAFLAGDTDRIYEATYSALDSLDLDEKRSSYLKTLDDIQAHPGIPENYRHVYTSYVERCLDIIELMREAVNFRTADDEAARETAKQKFIDLNEKLYGAPDTEIVKAMVREVLEDSANLEDPRLQEIRQEWLEALPEWLLSSGLTANKLKPSTEVTDFIKNFAEYLNAPFLPHANKLLELANPDGLPEDEVKITPTGIATIFQTILNEEFPDSGWTVVVEKSNAIKVVASEKKITVPENRQPATPETVRGLVVHEIGVHFLRSVMGQGSDLIPMRLGFAGFNDAEEGLATLLEASIKEASSRTGYQHYLAATLFNAGMSPDKVSEIVWRYKVIDEKIKKPAKEIDQEFLDKQKSTAFDVCFRSLRGTNGLPWYNMLNYFNGSHKMLEYISENMDDPDRMMLLFLGRIDPTNPDHVRGALDAKSKKEPSI
jgi:hypothetical protein